MPQETARGTDGSISYHPLAYRHGDVVQFGGCELMGGMTTCDEWTELRSPVRVGDQIELFNKDEYSHVYTSQGTPSRYEHVIYRRVIGEELVSLPELGRSVRAVRADTVFKQRITEATGDGQQWRFEATSSTWYAPGTALYAATSTFRRPCTAREEPRTSDWWRGSRQAPRPPGCSSLNEPAAPCARPR